MPTLEAGPLKRIHMSMIPVTVVQRPTLRFPGGTYLSAAGAARAYASTYMLYKHKKYKYCGVPYKAAEKRMVRRLTKLFKEWMK